MRAGRPSCRCFVEAEQELEVVVDRLHPRVELLFDVAGQKADVAAEREDRARHQQLRRTRCSSMTFCRPAAIASSVLPVPALPTSVTSLMSSLSSRSSAKCCSLLRGRMPHTPSRSFLTGATFLLVPSSGRARCARRCRDRAASGTRWRGSRAVRRWRRWAARPRRRTRSTAPAGDLELAVAGVELFDAIFSAFVVLGLEAERVGADAHVDVLGDEDRRAVARSVSRTSSAMSRMRCPSTCEASARRAAGSWRARLQACRRSRAAAPARGLPLAAELVEQARDLARVAAELRLFLLEVSISSIT